MKEDIHGFPFSQLPTSRGILLDLDDTLYCYAPCHEAAVAACYAEENLGLDEADFFASYRKNRTLVTQRLNNGGSCRSRLFAFLNMCEAQGLVSPYVAALKLDTVYWDSFLAAMTVHDSALEFIEACKERELPVCVVSDMTAAIQIKKLERLNLTGSVDFLVTSEEVGVEKPDRRMFEAGLKKLGLLPSEVVMAGDDWKKDVVGGQNAGIQSYHVTISA